MKYKESNKNTSPLISPSALKKMQNLENVWKKRIGKRIEELAVTPRHRQSKKLKGEDNLYSNRVGDYRIIYKIQDESPVLILDVGHRREIYDSN
jgi:mRNA-degrading endonuclease RelE of RelBE toxin-antitoxin system